MSAEQSAGECFTDLLCMLREVGGGFYSVWDPARSSVMYCLALLTGA